MDDSRHRFLKYQLPQLPKTTGFHWALLPGPAGPPCLAAPARPTQSTWGLPSGDLPRAAPALPRGCSCLRLVSAKPSSTGCHKARGFQSPEFSVG